MRLWHRLACLAACALAISRASDAEGQRVDSAWTIRGGSYDGITVPIDVAAASRKGRFWRLSSLRGEQRIALASRSLSEREDRLRGTVLAALREM